MTAPAVTNTFVANTTAQAAQVNTNFSDLVTYISNRNDATTTWDRLSVSSASAVPLIVNNSTGTSNIANFQDNGTNVFQIVDGGHVYMNATKRLYLDGGSDTYIFESGANTIDFFSNAALKFRIGGGTTVEVVASDFGIPAAKKLYLDGIANTYITEVSADQIDFVTGGTLALSITSAQVLDYRLAAVALGGGAAPTVGTIGGSGPASAGQNAWIKVKIAGTDSFIPIWR